MSNSYQDVAQEVMRQFEFMFPDAGESYRDLQLARQIINTVEDNLDPNRRRIHEGLNHPGDLDWEELASQDGDFLSQVGTLIVDGASVKVAITIGENEVNYQTHFYTPDGDGGFKILAGRLRGIGRCVVVAFDMET